MRTLRLFLVAAALGWGCGPASAQSLDADFRALQSRLLSMSGGYYTAAEWGAVFDRLEGLGETARREGRTDLVIEVYLLRAMAHADMRREYEQARAVLEDARRRYGESGEPNVKRIYGRLAEVYAALGDEAAIRKLIAEYRDSRAYDPTYYQANFAPGGPDSRITIARPSAGESDSITVTKMQQFQQNAALGPGAVFAPELYGPDANGRMVRLDDYRGRVVLVDFWVSGWHPWVRDLPQLKQAYQRFRPQGFAVVGVALDRDSARARRTLQQRELPWPSIMGDPALGASYGVFGEATNFLLDRQGRVLARNVPVADLPALLGRVL